jgi:hypothetical protein
MPNLLDTIKSKLRLFLSIPETENTFLVGTRSLTDNDRDRPAYSREEIMTQCLDAWRYNPLARRVVELITQYTVGNGFQVSSDDERTQKFIEEFWHHRLNQMDNRMLAISDELSRAGNLFLLISTDQGGMSYIRAVQTDQVEEIITAKNDPEQEIFYKLKENLDLDYGEREMPFYPAYDPTRDEMDEKGYFKPVMVHYAVNRPFGGLWGESDLSHLLKWLGRYTAWLEDRVRLNRFRNAFLYVVKASYSSETARKARQTELAANPPTPGSILVTDESEEWSVMSPKLEAMDANNDGIAIKKMIAAGAGIPLHFLAEPESSTRTTAESAGEPTYRKYEQRQQVMIWIIKDLLKIAIQRRSLVDQRLDQATPIEVHAADVSARDNESLARAGNSIRATVMGLYREGLIDKQEVLRIVYKYLSEEIDLEEMGERVKEKEVPRADTQRKEKL